MKYIFLFGFYFLFSQSVLGQNPFITKWDLDVAGSGTNQITFLVGTSGIVNYTWQEIGGGGASGTGNFSGSSAIITGLPSTGSIELSILPANFHSFAIANGPDKIRLRDVKQWGSVVWTNFANSFNGCIILNITATDIPNLSSATSLQNMFRSCRTLNGPTNIGSWNTSAVTNMSDMFADANLFNQPIGAWNTSAVTTMSSMFYKAFAFNQPIGTWNTNAVTDMGYMFFEAKEFNQAIGNWNVSAVTDMRYMFYEARAFNQDIGTWNTGLVRTFSNIFENARSFDQAIGNWNTSSVTNMNGSFRGAANFNKPLNSWNTTSVTTMFTMFSAANKFNQNISSFNLSNVTDLSGIFYNSGISQLNYDNMLIAWDAAGYTHKNLGNVYPLKYCQGSAARNSLVNFKYWNITDDTENCTNPEINIKSNNVSIDSGDTSPSLTDNTDFGYTSESLGYEIREFTIENLGTEALNLNPSVSIIKSGANPNDFDIIQIPAILIPINGSTNFRVAFNPSENGLRTATLSIPNNDVNENPYTFSLQGFGCGSLQLNNTVSTGITIEKAERINSNSQISNANVTYSTSKVIELSPNFKAENTVFLAQIGGCN